MKRLILIAATTLAIGCAQKNTTETEQCKHYNPTAHTCLDDRPPVERCYAYLDTTLPEPTDINCDSLMLLEPCENYSVSCETKTP